MPLSHSARSRAVTLVCALAATASFAPSAHAITAAQDQALRDLPVTVTEPVTRDSPANVYPSPCPRFNVVVARGTSQDANQDEGLDGLPYWQGSIYRWGPDQPSGVWWRIASELYYPENGTDAALTPTSTSVSPQLLRTDLTYPAGNDFNNSTPGGTKNLIRYLNRMNVACPSTKFVLLGYSQGALVIGDALSVPSRRKIWFSGTDQLTTAATNAVKVVGIIANPGFNPLFKARNQADYSQPVISSGYKIGTYADTNKGMNDGNFIPSYSGVLVRSVTAYPVKAVPNPLYPGTVASDYIVNPSLTEDVSVKIRDYCKSRDYICQNGNPNSSPYYHEQYKNETTHRKNLAVFSLEKLKPLV
jgi:hypothetical protein